MAVRKRTRPLWHADALAEYYQHLGTAAASGDRDLAPYDVLLEECLKLPSPLREQMFIDRTMALAHHRVEDRRFEEFARAPH